MIKDQSNIDNSLKQKFENFAPSPPDHIWEGVKTGIVKPVTPSFFAQYWKGLTIAAVIAGLIITGIIFLKPGVEKSVSNTDQISINKESGKTSSEKLKDEREAINKNYADVEANQPEKTREAISKEEYISIENENSSSELASDRKTLAESTNNISKESKNNTDLATKEKFNYSAQKHDLGTAVTGNEKAYKFSENKFDEKFTEETYKFELTKINHINIALNHNITPQLITPVLEEQVLLGEEMNKRKGLWSLSLFLSPEMLLNNFDSVEVLTNYTIGVEPSYYFNNHLFIRFGLNASYTRDRGFANLDYLSYDLLGSYDYVYDITFDSIDGEVVPTYHTYEMEVWDTVRHLEINAITNNYYYIQTPLLLGYYKNSSNFKWYFYGGPAFNILVSKQIDKPLEGVDYIELLNLNKELPERSPYYFQLWVGAGVEFKAGKNFGLAFEPNYRYYLNNVFKEQPYNKSSLSGLSIRFGLTYTIH